jgi:hypothetical protein
MNNKLLIALAVAGFGIAASSIPAQAAPGWWNSLNGSNGTNTGTGLAGSLFNGTNGVWHHRWNNGLLNNGVSNGLANTPLTNTPLGGIFNNGLTGNGWHRWNNPNYGSNGYGWNNGLTNVGYNNYNNYNYGYNNGFTPAVYNNSGFMGNLFGGGGIMRRERRLANEQNHLQSLLASGTLSPQQAAFLQNKLNRVEAQEASLSGANGGFGRRFGF